MLSCGNYYFYLLNGSLHNNSIVYDSSNRLPKPLGPFCLNSFKCTKQHQKLIHSAARSRHLQSLLLSSSNSNSDDQLSAEIQIQNKNLLVGFQLFDDSFINSSSKNKLDLNEPFLEFTLSKSSKPNPIKEFNAAMNNLFLSNNVSVDLSQKNNIVSSKTHDSK